MSNKRESKNNLILKKQDLVLLHKSEEVKNVEIYGNLYECLKFYNILSKKDLKQDIVFNDKARMTLTHNVKTMMDRIQGEWYAKKSWDIAPNEVHCQLCGAKNKYVCYIKNRLNGEELHVGRECVKNYKDINDADVVLSQLNLAQRDIKKDARRSGFDLALGVYIDFTKNAKEKIESFPVLLPYNLYTNIEKALTSCNKIRSSYISSGGDLDEHIKKFMIAKSEFEELYKKAIDYYNKNKNNRLICTREIANWLNTNNPSVITEIRKSKGILNENTLQHVCEPNFIASNLPLFSSCIKDKDVKFLNVEGDVIKFKIKNARYVQPIYFTMTIKSFMKSIGCHCLTQKGYKFSKTNLSPTVTSTASNINSTINYLIGILNKYGHSLIIEDKTSQLYCVKNQNSLKNKWSRHVKEQETKSLYKLIKIEKVLNIMSQILLYDNKSESEIFDIIIHKIGISGKWITKEEKDRNTKIASEAAGMQKQKEFTPYL